MARTEFSNVRISTCIGIGTSISFCTKYTKNTKQADSVAADHCFQNGRRISTALVLYHVAPLRRALCCCTQHPSRGQCGVVMSTRIVNLMRLIRLILTESDTAALFVRFYNEAANARFVLRPRRRGGGA